MFLLLLVKWFKRAKPYCNNFIIVIIIIIIIIIVIVMKEIAEQTGNREEAEKLRSELEELEEKASHLDKVRSKNLSAIRYGVLEIPLWAVYLSSPFLTFGSCCL